MKQLRISALRLIKVAVVLWLSQSFVYAAAGEEKYEYDALGRLKKVTYPSTQAINYSYDPAGNRSSVWSPASASESFTMTQGWYNGGGQVNSPPSWYGFYTGMISGASLSPATLSGGKTIKILADGKRVGAFLQTSLQIAGFASDPGASWLTSIICGGVSRTGVTATYSYASGQAFWVWKPATFTAMGFTSSGSKSCTIAHI